jgi:hypothetical protein
LVRDCDSDETTLLRHWPRRSRFQHEPSKDLTSRVDEKLQFLAREAHVFGSPTDGTEVHIPVMIYLAHSTRRQLRLVAATPKME